MPSEEYGPEQLCPGPRFTRECDNAAPPWMRHDNGKSFATKASTSSTVAFPVSAAI